MFKRMHGRDEFGGGVGAGLTIAQKLVQRHGGQIWIDSSLGKGTTVYFTLAGPSAEHG
jgi:chemotaxis family two-component system sensor kinase Cph1